MRAHFAAFRNSFGDSTTDLMSASELWCSEPAPEPETRDAQKLVIDPQLLMSELPVSASEFWCTGAGLKDFQGIDAKEEEFGGVAPLSVTAEELWQAMGHGIHAEVRAHHEPASDKIIEEKRRLHRKEIEEYSREVADAHAELKVQQHKEEEASERLRKSAEYAQQVHKALHALRRQQADEYASAKNDFVFRNYD
jgi:hypothetical protein